MVALSGFDHPEDPIHLFVGGSVLHGAKVGQTDDIDLYRPSVITLPRPEKDLLIEIRTGEWPMEGVLAHARKLSKKVEDAVASSPLPERSIAARFQNCWRKYSWSSGGRPNCRYLTLNSTDFNFLLSRF